MLSSAGRDQIAADENEREQHQDEIERVHCQRTIMLGPLWSDKHSQLSGSNVLSQTRNGLAKRRLIRSYLSLFEVREQGVVNFDYLSQPSLAPSNVVGVIVP